MMSTKEYKLIKENWDKFVTEETATIEPVEEEQQIQEIATGIGFFALLFRPISQCVNILKTLGEGLKAKIDTDDPQIEKGLDSYIALCEHTATALQSIETIWDDWGTKNPKFATVLKVKFYIFDVVGIAISNLTDYGLKKLNSHVRKILSLPPEKLNAMITDTPSEPIPTGTLPPPPPGPEKRKKPSGRLAHPKRADTRMPAGSVPPVRR